MKKAYVFLFVVGLGLALMAGGAFAAQATGTLNVTATVANTAKLDIAPANISFPDADPDTTPNIPASPASISISAKAKTGNASNVTLTALAGGELTSGSDTIAINNVTWTGGGAGFNANGTLNRTVAQSVGSWSGSGNRSGTQTFSLANSWSYAPGNYTATITYTLTSP